MKPIFTVLILTATLALPTSRAEARRHAHRAATRSHAHAAKRGSTKLAHARADNNSGGDPLAGLPGF